LHGAEFTADGCTINIENDANEFEISVYYFPSFGSAVNSSVIANDAGDTRVEIVGAENIITTFINGLRTLVFGNSTVNSTAAIEIYNATDKFGGFRYDDKINLEDLDMMIILQNYNSAMIMEQPGKMLGVEVVEIRQLLKF